VAIVTQLVTLDLAAVTGRTGRRPSTSLERMLAGGVVTRV
jgi:hypothetical protein